MHLESSRNIFISVEKNSADITRFVKSEVQRLISKRLLLDGKVSKNLKARILEILINGAQGMFRWVEMSLEALSRIKFAPDFKKALGQLPKRLSGLYEIIYDQIDQTENYGRHVAIKTLTWLLCAQRLLRAEELLAAVHAVDAGASSDSDEDEDSEEAGSPENDVLRLCRNLVVMDSEQRTFRFAHQSVREYLLRKSEYTVVRQHALATERCLDVYLTEPSPGLRVSKSVQQNDTLKRYAGAYWPVHYTYIGECEFPETHEKVSRFLMEGTRTSHHYIQWASSIRSKDDEDNYLRLNQALELGLDDRLEEQLCFAVSTPVTYRSVACAFGFSKFLKGPALSIMEVNQRQKSGNFDFTFLVFAVEGGYDQIVQLLLDQGADINAQIGRYGNALCTAIYNSDDKMVQMLLDKGADVDTQSNYGSALQAASYANNDKLMQMLLEKEVDINVRSEMYGIALKAASDGGHERVVQMLFDKGVDMDAQDYGTALWLASFNNHDNVVQMLLDKGADVKAQGGYHGITLQAASGEGQNKVAQILLDKGADVNAQGGEYGNALQAASLNGHHKVVQMMLDNGADVNAQGGEFGNALNAASYEGHNQVARLLLDHNAAVNQKDIQGRTAFHLASAGGQMETVETLLSFGADPTTIDMQGRNSLHHAASKGSTKMVHWLLKKGFDPNYADRDGWSSLHWAARNDSVGIMEVLRIAGARSTVEAIKGWTPASVAIFHHNDSSSRSRENTESELAAERSISSSTVAVESVDDEHKVSPGIQHKRVTCDGCQLVSFDLNKHVKSYI